MIFCAKPTACKSVKVCQNLFMIQAKNTRLNPLRLSQINNYVSITRPFGQLFAFSTPAPSSRFVVVFVLFCFLFCLFVYLLLSFGSLLGFLASDVLKTICHLAIVNVCVIIILSTGNSQISILLLCFLCFIVGLMIRMNE